MVFYCCVRGCTKTSKEEVMHIFPKDKERFDQWTKLISFAEMKREKRSSYRICDKHFSETMKYSTYHNRTNIKADAVPDLFLPSGNLWSKSKIRPDMSDREIERRLINEELCDTDDERKSIDNYDYVTIKNENMDDLTIAGLISEKPCDTEYKQENIHNYVSIKDENIDDLNVVIPETELRTDCTDDKLCPNETVISGGYIKQEPGDMKDEQGSIQYYPNIKDENMDDLTVEVQEAELMTDCMDNKVCMHETIISGGYIKNEPCESGNIHNNIHMTGCEECGEEYDLYCLKCPMLIRIFDSNNPDGTDNSIRATLPKNFLDICKTQSGIGVLAIRAIPKGVVFGPFKGLDSTKDELVSKWKLKNKELAVTKDPKWLNWMQYIRRSDESFHQNLLPFQYEDGLYYRSKCYINMGDELLVRWDIDDKETEDQDMEDSYWEPQVYESLDDSYACTFCCVGYKSINHLEAHNSTCIEKRNKKDFCKEIVQCDTCKIYLDKAEYSDYHMDRCNKSNEKSVLNSRCRRNCESLIRNGDKSFSCTICPYTTTRKSCLKRHITIHNDDKPLACTLCPYRTKTKSRLRIHIAIHNGDKSFACTLCPYKTTTHCSLKRHMAVHTDDRAFACSLCSYKAATKSILKQHMAVHNADTPFACALCPYKTKTKSNLNQHLANHNSDTPFACVLCPYKTKTQSRLRRHITSHNSDKPFECTLCPYKTTRKLYLKRHLTVHTDDKPFECTLCPYKTTTNSFLKRHIAIHNDDRPFPCTLCPYKATTRSILKQHIAVHNGERPFECTLCPYKTKTRSNLNQHLATHNADTPFACSLCSYKTKTQSRLRRHIASHNSDKPFACTLCSHKTTTNCNLKRHMSVHNGDKPFACTQCPYKTTVNCSLKRHMAVHDDRTYACTHCSYKAAKKSILERHIAKHSADRPFACTLCPHKATTKSNLKQHISVHNDDKPFACTLCLYKTAINSRLKRHVAIHNSDKLFACTLCPYKTAMKSLLKQHIAIHNANKL